MALGVQKALFNIITSILIMGGYAFYVFVINKADSLARINEAQFWGQFMLTMIIVTIILKIALYIIFTIVRKMRDENADIDDIDFMDEFDKQVEMKSDRRGNHFFFFGLITSMIPIAMGYPLSYMFIILISSGFIAGIMGDLWKIYFYNKGL